MRFVAASFQLAGMVRQVENLPPHLRKERAVKMHVPPTAVAALPDARFLDGLACRSAVGGQALVEAHVSDDGGVSQEAHLGRAHRRVVCSVNAAQVEVETMEAQPFDKLPPGLGLKRRQ